MEEEEGKSIDSGYKRFDFPIEEGKRIPFLRLEALIYYFNGLVVCVQELWLE